MWIAQYIFTPSVKKATNCLLTAFEKKKKVHKIKQPESIKCSKLLVKHNKSELCEWGELLHSPVSEAQRKGWGGAATQELG